MRKLFSLRSLIRYYLCHWYARIDTSDPHNSSKMIIPGLCFGCDETKWIACPHNGVGTGATQLRLSATFKRNEDGKVQKPIGMQKDAMDAVGKLWGTGNNPGRIEPVRLSSRTSVTGFALQALTPKTARTSRSLESTNPAKTELTSSSCPGGVHSQGTSLCSIAY